MPVPRFLCVFSGSRHIDIREVAAWQRKAAWCSKFRRARGDFSQIVAVLPFSRCSLVFSGYAQRCFTRRSLLSCATTQTHGNLHCSAVRAIAKPFWRAGNGLSTRIFKAL